MKRLLDFIVVCFCMLQCFGQKTGSTDENSMKSESQSQSSNSALPTLLKSPDALQRLQELQGILGAQRNPVLNYNYDPFKQYDPVAAPYLRSPFTSQVSHTYDHLGAYGHGPQVKNTNPNLATTTLLSILNDLKAIKGYDGPVYTEDGELDYKEEYFNTVFKHLWHFLSRQEETTFCPEIYDQVGDMCLFIDEEADTLNFHEARLKCYAAYGGDLAVIRTPNEHRAIINYLWKKDEKEANDYFIGCLETADAFNWIDNRAVKATSPYFSEHIPEATAAGQYKQAAPVQTSRACTLSSADAYYMVMRGIDGQDNVNTLPLCQYIHGRDEANFHYAQQIYWTNFDKKYNKWFFPEEDYKITIKHRHPTHYGNQYANQHPNYQQPPPYVPTSNYGYNKWKTDNTRTGRELNNGEEQKLP